MEAAVTSQPKAAQATPESAGGSLPAPEGAGEAVSPSTLEGSAEIVADERIRRAASSRPMRRIPCASRTSACASPRVFGISVLAYIRASLRLSSRSAMASATSWNACATSTICRPDSGEPK